MSSANGSNSTGLVERLRRLDLHGPGDSRPKYERLRSFISSEVGSGLLQAGASLPSEKHLSQILSVARTTVRQALSELEKEGIVQRRHGAGTFVCGVPKRKRRLGMDVFALVVPDTGTKFWLSLQAGFQSAATDVYRQILACNTENDLGKQADIFIQLVQKSVAGVALAPTSWPPTPAYQVKHLQDHGIPVVLCHRPVNGIDAPLLAIPFHDVGHMAGRLLIDNGHRRVAFFSIDKRSEASRGYEAGLREVIEAAGGALPESLVYWGENVSPDTGVQKEAVFQRLQEMFKGSNRPTAIMASLDPLAERILLMLGEMGLSVPEDVSVISVGGADRSGALTERLTSITVDETDLGRRAARLLHEMCAGQLPLDEAERINVPLWVAEGSTVGPAGGS